MFMQLSPLSDKNITLKTWEQQMEHGEDCHMRDKQALYIKFKINQYSKLVQAKLTCVQLKLPM